MAKTNLKVNNDTELLSYIINNSPILKKEIDLPKRDSNLGDYGRLIFNNERYRNDFLNTVNIIGLTVFTRNRWDNPWENFTNKGHLDFGDSIRETILDLVKSHKYDANSEDLATDILKEEEPAFMQYIHHVNFQQYYKTTTALKDWLMAFEEGGVIELVEEAVAMLIESYNYDKYLLDKYMLCRRIVDGTLTVNSIDTTKDIREQVSSMKSVSNRMTFRSPNFNYVGIRRASKFDEQYLILNTEYDARVDTEVLATSFFRDSADFKTHHALIDSFKDTDTERLLDLLDDVRETLFTADELAVLEKVVAVVIDKDFFQDYEYNISADGKLQTEFFNPATLKTNHYLHVWGVFSTSPFSNACVFAEIDSSDITVTGITVQGTNEYTFNANDRLDLQLNILVDGSPLANKAYTISVTDTTGQVKAYDTGKVLIRGKGTTGTATLTITSVLNQSVSATVTITFR